MASFVCDLTLCEWDTFAETYPGTPQRDETVRKIFEEAGADQSKVQFKVLREHGPAGGNPECVFIGPHDEVRKIVEWYIDGMGETWDWAEEYWTDREDTQ